MPGVISGRFRLSYSVILGRPVGFLLVLSAGAVQSLPCRLMVYLVGVCIAHVAIGTSALAVAADAAIGLFARSRLGDVKWRCSLVFALSGVTGAVIGWTLGKAFDGQKLLFLFCTGDDRGRHPDAPAGGAVAIPR